ncbi:MAG: DUF4411 family protein [Alphaproteobacteria bacterium]
MIYLLDADTLIKADSTYYPRKRFAVFWEWLAHNGSKGVLKIPVEQYEEIIVGRGDLVAWLKDANNKEALLLDEEVDPKVIESVVANGYAPDRDETELENLGRDPFLISYGLTSTRDRCIVTFEVSAPSKSRANRKIPDVCHALGVNCVTLFDVIEALDFTTDWTVPPS